MDSRLSSSEDHAPRQSYVQSPASRSSSMQSKICAARVAIASVLRIQSAWEKFGKGMMCAGALCRHIRPCPQAQIATCVLACILAHVERKAQRPACALAQRRGRSRGRPTESMSAPSSHSFRQVGQEHLMMGLAPQAFSSTSWIMLVWKVWSLLGMMLALRKAACSRPCPCVRHRL